MKLAIFSVLGGVVSKLVGKLRKQNGPRRVGKTQPIVLVGGAALIVAYWLGLLPDFITIDDLFLLMEQVMYLTN